MWWEGKHGWQSRARRGCGAAEKNGAGKDKRPATTQIGKNPQVVAATIARIRQKLDKEIATLETEEQRLKKRITERISRFSV